MFGILTAVLKGRSYKWYKVRKKHIEKQPCCQACGSCEKPEVHHILPFHLYPELELDPDNLITLCDKYCHFVFGHLMNWKSYNVDIIEDAKKYREKKMTRPEVIKFN